jgi:hypothetical protein
MQRHVSIFGMSTSSGRLARVWQIVDAVGRFPMSEDKMISQFGPILCCGP